MFYSNFRRFGCDFGDFIALRVWTGHSSGYILYTLEVQSPTTLACWCAKLARTQLMTRSGTGRNEIKHIADHWPVDRPLSNPILHHWPLSSRRLLTQYTQLSVCDGNISLRYVVQCYCSFTKAKFHTFAYAITYLPYSLIAANVNVWVCCR